MLASLPLLETFASSELHPVQLGEVLAAEVRYQSSSQRVGLKGSGLRV